MQLKYQLNGSEFWLESYTRLAQAFVQSEKGYDDFLRGSSELVNTIQLLQYLSKEHCFEVFSFLNDVRQRGIGLDGQMDVVWSDVFFLRNLTRTILCSSTDQHAVEHIFENLHEQAQELLLTVDFKVQQQEILLEARLACAEVIGSLSLFKLDNICNKYRAFVYERMNDEASQERRRQELLLYIEAIRFLKFQFATEQQQQNSITALKLLNPMMYKATYRKSQVHHMMCKSLTVALAPIVRDNPWYHTTTGLLEAWYATIRSVRDMVGPWVKSKTKHYADGYPLYTQLTCLLSEPDFETEFQSLMAELKNLLQQKAYKQLAFRCIKVLVFSFARRNQTKKVDFKFLEGILLMAKKGQIGKECQDDLMNICADTLSYCGKSAWIYWKDLMGCDNLQNILVVMKAITYIILEAPTQLQNFIGQSKYLNDRMTVAAVDPDMTATNTLDLMIAKIHPLEVYNDLHQSLECMNDIFERIWQKVAASLPKNFGFQLQQDVSDKDKILNEVLKYLFRLFPYISPSSWQPAKGCSILAKYYVRSSVQIQEQALAAIKRFLYIYPQYRSELLSSMCEVLVGLKLEDFKESTRGMDLLLFTLQEWYSCGIAGSDVLSNIAQDKVEAVCLLYLCSPDSKVRLSSIEVMRSLKCLCMEVSGDIFGGSLDDEEKLFVVDMIEEEGDGIATSYHEDFGPRAEIYNEIYFVQNAKFLGVLQESVQDDDSPLRWSRILNEIVRQASLLELNSCCVASDWVVSKLADLDIQSLLSSGDPSGNNNRFKLWRNLLLFQAASLKKEYSEHKLIVKNMLKDFSSCTDILLLETLSYSLGHCNRDVHEIIVQELRQYFEINQGISDRRPSRRLRDDSKLQLANIVRLLSGHLDLRCVAPSVVEFFRDWLNGLHKQMKEHQDVSPIAHQLRYCVCCVVKQVSKYSSIINGDLRVRLFQLIQLWGQVDDQQVLLPPSVVLDGSSDADQKSRFREGGHKRSLTTQIELHDPQVQFMALQAVASLLCCQIKNLPMLKGEGIQWINQMLSNGQEQLLLNQNAPTSQDLGMEGLRNLLQANISLFNDFIVNCYDVLLPVSKGYFIVLSQIFCFGIVNIDIAPILCLAFYKLCDPDKQVREAAVALMKSLADIIIQNMQLSMEVAGEVKAFAQSVVGCDQESFLRLQHDLAILLSKVDERLCWDVCIEIIQHLNPCLQCAVQHNILQILCFWVQQIVLSENWEGNQTAELLQDLYNVTQQLEYQQLPEIELLWQCVSKLKQNCYVILKFIMYRGVEAMNIQIENSDYFQQYLKVSQKIVQFLGGVPQHQSLLVNFLKQYVHGSDQEQLFSNKFCGRTGGFRTLQSLSKDFVNQKDQGKSVEIICCDDFFPHKTVLALCFLECVFHEQEIVIRSNLVTILHICVIIIVCEDPLLPRHCIQLLMNLLNVIVTSQMGLHMVCGNATEDHSAMLSFMNQLQDYVIYPLQDAAGSLLSEKSRQTKLQNLVSKCGQFFLMVYPNIRSIWAEKALKWAFHCSNVQLAIYSLQVYVCLDPLLCGDSVIYLVFGVTKCVSILSRQGKCQPAQDLLLQVLISLKSVILNDAGANILMFPQLFWVALILLKLESQEMQSHALSIFYNLISKLNLASTNVQSILLSCISSISSEDISADIDASYWCIGWEVLQLQLYKSCSSLVVVQQLFVQVVYSELSQDMVLRILESLAHLMVSSQPSSVTSVEGVKSQNRKQRLDNSSQISLILGDVTAQLLVSILLLLPLIPKLPVKGNGKELRRCCLALSQAAYRLKYFQLALVLQECLDDINRIITQVVAAFCPKYTFLITLIVYEQAVTLPPCSLGNIVVLLRTIFSSVDTSVVDIQCQLMLDKLLCLLYDKHASNLVNNNIVDLLRNIHCKVNVVQAGSDQFLKQDVNRIVYRSLQRIVQSWYNDLATFSIEDILRFFTS